MNLTMLFYAAVAAYMLATAPASSAPGQILIEGQKNTAEWYKCTDSVPALEVLSRIESDGAQFSMETWAAHVGAGNCTMPESIHEMNLVELVKSAKDKHSDRVYSVVRLQDVAGRDFWAITGYAVQLK